MQTKQLWVIRNEEGHWLGANKKWFTTNGIAATNIKLYHTRGKTRYLNSCNVSVCAIDLDYAKSQYNLVLRNKYQPLQLPLSA